jgi:hypothetical protein
MIVCDDDGYCGDDGSGDGGGGDGGGDGSGDGGSPDLCTSISLNIYYATQTWRLDVGTLNDAFQSLNNDGASFALDVADGNEVQAVIDAGLIVADEAAVAYFQIQVDNDVTNLDALVGGYRANGC